MKLNDLLPPGAGDRIKKVREMLGYSKKQFVDAIDDENRSRYYEKDYPDEATGVKVVPIFVETGKARE